MSSPTSAHEEWLAVTALARYRAADGAPELGQACVAAVRHVLNVPPHVPLEHIASAGTDQLREDPRTADELAELYLEHVRAHYGDPWGEDDIL